MNPVSAKGMCNEAATWEYLWVHQGSGTQRVAATMYSFHPEDYKSYIKIGVSGPKPKALRLTTQSESETFLFLSSTILLNAKVALFKENFIDHMNYIEQNSEHMFCSLNKSKRSSAFFCFLNTA